MKNFLKKIFIWIAIKAHTIIIVISLALRNTEIEILKANPDDLDESKKKTTRKLHRNVLLERFYAGQRDEKYVQDYYELLKKADEFMLKASHHKKAVAADKWGMNVGHKDQYGRRYDHIGFFDDSHKHAGKTMGEVIEMEMKERRTDDDDYELERIFDNKPIEVGLSKIDGFVDEEFKVSDLRNKSKSLEFPLGVVRDVDVPNKIEQLTEYLHIKSIGFEHKQLEFFTHKKFKIDSLDEDSEMFKQIINFKEVYFKDKYGDLVGYSIMKYDKKIKWYDYIVLKFHAVELKTIK